MDISMTTVESAVRRILELGYYPVDWQYATSVAQFIDGKWYMPKWGADTFQHIIKEWGNAPSTQHEARREKQSRTNGGDVREGGVKI